MDRPREERAARAMDVGGGEGRKVEMGTIPKCTEERTKAGLTIKILERNYGMCDSDPCKSSLDL